MIMVDGQELSGKEARDFVVRSVTRFVTLSC